MANVTDPLACPIHGTNPQNLIEYITRQRIYDSQYWKEQCFGLTAADVVEKAAIHLQAIGGSYGGNCKPTRFLCLILKMLQIQPDEEIVDELIDNEDFKYVRALGVFYLRLTGRPAQIYEKLEPLYNDYRKLKYRNHSDWKLTYMDEFVDELLRNERVCGIALPRLPKREMLEEAGYLDGQRKSAILNLLGRSHLNDDSSDDDKNRFDYCMNGVAKIESLLKQMAEDGNAAAQQALSTRNNYKSSKPQNEGESQKFEISGNSSKRKYDEALDSAAKPDGFDVPVVQEKNSERRNEKKVKSKKFGSLFKSKSNTSGNNDEAISTGGDAMNIDENNNSEEYWNDQRAKLGLKPLKK